MREQSATGHVAAAITEGWMEGGSFFGSILAGTLIGLALDWWLGTTPWLVVAGIVLGAYSAFAHLWRSLKSQPMPPAVTLPDYQPAPGSPDPDQVTP